MRGTRSASRIGGTLLRLGLFVGLTRAIAGGLPATAGETASKPKDDPVAIGYEIFNREWMPDDPRGHGGDGLGPVYNDSSCIACHNSGGSGGAGPVSKNIDILHASRINGLLPGGVHPVGGRSPFDLEPAGEVADKPADADAARSAELDPLLAIHAGFKTSRTVVLHKFGIDPNYDAWRGKALGQGGIQTLDAPNVPPPISSPPAVVERMIETADPVFVQTVVVVDSGVVAQAPAAPVGRGGGVDEAGVRAAERLARVQQPMLRATAPILAGSFQVTRSQRSPTPLFGLGLIDAIPAEALEALAKKQASETPATVGRVSRLKDGRIGRLGWKGQTANVEDFVLNACAVEVGLEVPGHSQALQPQAPKYRPPGNDLTAGECDALVAYVRSLPRPVERKPAGHEEADFLGAGKATFARIGCAGCHAPTVAGVEGIYSDLLLHDMGPQMEDSGSYGDDGDDGSDEPLTPLLAANAGQKAQGQPAPKAPTVATRREWRTPPLWGFRDSGPYLHDGRAQGLEQAVAMHGGQGSPSAQQFFRLTARERLELEAFLKSLVAPPSDLLARTGD